MDPTKKESQSFMLPLIELVLLLPIGISFVLAATGQTIPLLITAGLVTLPLLLALRGWGWVNDASTRNMLEKATRMGEELQAQLEASTTERDTLLTRATEAESAAYTRDRELKLAKASYTTKLEEAAKAFAQEKMRAEQLESDLEQQLNTLRGDLDSRSNEVELMSSRIAGIEKVNADLRKHLSGREQTIAEQEQTIASTTAELTACRHTIARLEPTIADQYSVIEQLKGWINDRDSELETLRSKLADMESYIVDRSTRHESELTKLQEYTRGVESRLTEAAKLAEEFRDRAVALGESERRYRDEADRTRKELQTAMAAQSALQREKEQVSELRASIESIRQENQRLQTLLDASLSVEESVAAREASRATELESQLTSVRSEYEQLVESRKLVSDEIVREREQFAKLNELFHSKSNEIELANAKAAELEQELRDRQTKTQLLQAKLAARLEEEARAAESARQRLAELELELATRNDQHTQVDLQIVELKERLAATELDRASLQATVDRMTAEMVAMQECLEQNNRELDALVAEIRPTGSEAPTQPETGLEEEWNNRLKALETEVATRDAEIAWLRDELSDYARDAKKATTERDALLAQLAQLQNNESVSAEMESISNMESTSEAIEPVATVSSDSPIDQPAIVDSEPIPSADEPTPEVMVSEPEKPVDAAVAAESSPTTVAELAESVNREEVGLEPAPEVHSELSDDAIDTVIESMSPADSSSPSASDHESFDPVSVTDAPTTEAV